MANGILTDQLPNSELGLFGATPPIRPGALRSSTMHYQSSINNIPEFGTELELAPSVLDLDGLTPVKYIDTVQR